MMKQTLSAIALTGLLLTGCSGGTTEVARSETPSSPSPSPSPTATATKAVTSSEPVESVGTSPFPPSTTVMVPESPVQAETTAATTSTTTTPPVAITPTPAEVTTGASVTPGGSWVSMDVTVTTAAEAEKLTQTSPDFRAFVAKRVETPDASGCQSEFTVQAFHPSGFAAGQDFAPECGGSQNIWGLVGGQWETIMAMQSVVECTEMKVNDIPKGIPDIPCTDANGDIVDW